MAVSFFAGTTLFSGATPLLRNVSAATVTLWVSIQSAPSVRGRILDITNGLSPPSDKRRAGISINNSRHVEVQGVSLDADVTSTLTDAGDAIPLNSIKPWTHLACIWDYTNALGYLYVDGDIRINGASFGGMTHGNTSNTDAVAVGLGTTQSSPRSENFTGSVEDVRVYTRALSADEISDQFFRMSQRDEHPQDMVCHLGLNERSGAASTGIVRDTTNGIATFTSPGGVSYVAGITRE